MLNAINIVLDILLFVVKWIGIIFSPILIAFILQFIYLYVFKKHRFKKGKRVRIKKSGFLYRLLILFPKQYFLDLFARDPEEFNAYGVHLIAGEQGSGKTITLVHMLQQYQKQFPKCKVRTNFNYKDETSSITHWKNLVLNSNGTYGQIEVLDEIQNWFNSNQSRNFPPEMLTEVTQQRKQRKIIIGTSQIFTRVAKPIREQTSLLYEPMTILGCLTIVRVYKPKISCDDGQKDDKSFRKMYFFVHSKEIRDAFDTYKKIEMLTETDFVPTSEQLRNQSKSILIN